jgi:hypothetical protein
MNQEMIAPLAVLGVVLVTGLIAIPLNEEATMMPNVFASHGSSPAACEADGYEAGQDGPFSQELYETCQEIGGGDEYYDAFIEGCMDADNSREVCESATDAD